MEETTAYYLGASKCPHARSNSNLSPCPDKSEAVMRGSEREIETFSCFEFFFQPATAVLVVLLWGGFVF